jgi:membrane-bound lytic murein transglycosylase D
MLIVINGNTMRYVKLQLIFFLMTISGILQAQDSLRNDTVIRKNGFIEDDPVAAMLDSLATLRIFGSKSFLNTNENQSSRSYSDNDINYFPDSVYRNRITDMSLQSPFEYVYNTEVRNFIDLYAYRKRGLTERILGLSQIYFPLFEEQLDKYQMPLELKYLAVIESALNPVANSKAGAKGLWQFMYGTGKVYGLKISSYVDDRFDPIKSTIAACEHLTDLYNIYGNWSLALAAYNSGAGNVNKAIRRSGGAKNFWIIQKYLPKETRSYVPAFIAASYVLTYASEHHISPVDPGILFYEIDTVIVRNPISFDQLSEMLNIPMEEIQFLNPAYKKGIIPATCDNPYVLRLRKQKVADFINNESAIYCYKTRKGMEKDSLESLVYRSSRETTEYVVKKGETISSIAKKFHMSVADIKGLNNLQKSYVKPKQRLFVYVGPPKGKAPEKSIVSAPPPADSNAKLIPEPIAETPQVITTHTVKKGETLNKIAVSYGITVDNLVKWNNLKSQNIIIGQKLKLTGIETEPLAKNETGKTNIKTGTTTSKTSQKKTVSSQKYIWHTIQPGDNLWDIAEKYDGATVAQIKKLNSITNSQRLKVGQKIKVMPAN